MHRHQRAGDRRTDLDPRKPQCQIVALAKEQGRVAVSVGCILSRTRIGMPSTEMTCAIPSALLDDVVERVRAVAAKDAVVASYAAEDVRRFVVSRR